MSTEREYRPMAVVTMPEPFVPAVQDAMTKYGIRVALVHVDKLDVVEMHHYSTFPDGDLAMRRLKALQRERWIYVAGAVGVVFMYLLFGAFSGWEDQLPLLWGLLWVGLMALPNRTRIAEMRRVVRLNVEFDERIMKRFE